MALGDADVDIAVWSSDGFMSTILRSAAAGVNSVPDTYRADERSYQLAVTANGLNRYRGKRSGAVVVARCAAGSAMLLSEAIRLGLQQEQHHESIDTWHHAAASTHA